MGTLLTVLVIILLLGSAGLQLRGKQRLSCWMLAIFPGFACVAYLRDLAQGAERLGLAAYQSDRRQFGAALVLFAFSILAAYRSQWRWLFWIEWIFNAIACGVLIYLVFFWKVFR